MAYTPNNNPYIAGDPYSYDLKWIVAQIKAHSSALSNLDARIAAEVMAALDEHDPIYFSNAEALIYSGIKTPALAYIEGYYTAGDGGANLYITTNDYNDIISAPFYITLDGANRWALPVILTPYVTPEMFGAVGDDTADDSAAFNAALLFDLPIYIGPKIYKIDTPIVVGYNKIIAGTYGAERCVIHGSIISEGRYSQFLSFTIRGDGTGSGLVLNNTGLNHMLKIENMIIEDFNIGIEIATKIWDCTFTSIRLNRCATAIKTTANTSHFSVAFTNIYCNACDKNIDCNGLAASFYDCNFALANNGCIALGNDSFVTFQSCNFECDEQVDITGAMFELSSSNYAFKNCRFLINASATAHVIGVYQIRGLIVENCSYRTKTGNAMLDDNFWNKNALGTAYYGAIQFIGGNDNFPRPIFASSGQIPNAHDFQRGTPIRFNSTSIDTTKLDEGAVLYQLNTHKLCYFNGTNVVDTDGNIIV